MKGIVAGTNENPTTTGDRPAGVSTSYQNEHDTRFKEYAVSVSLNWERKERVLVGVLDGSIEGSNAESLLEALESGIDDADSVLLLDFEKVSFVCGVGLGVALLIARRFSESDKAFGVCTPAGPIREILAASGFDRMVTVYESRNQAIDRFRKHMT